ncbi:MAG: hypothetical protein CVT98_09195 [Bacteroidetes bacterium HGW-Bacteroidetes-15]|nr:MAG: hypothetical protein CVT98_09195 [Bacteroidetes bacterium HGW-Bacteroidetes-15]
MIRKNIFTLFAIFGILSFFSCEKEVDESEADELLRLQAYMSIHYPDLTPTPSGLYYIIYEQGSGEFPVAGNYLLFDFTASNLDDNVFETTSKTTAFLHDIYSKKVHYAPKFYKHKEATAPMIKGLTEGFSLLREGSKARFIMPSKLAYGSYRYNGLYPYSSVIYDVDLKRIIADPEAYELELITTYITENYPDSIIENLLVDGIYILENTLDEIDEEEEELSEPIVDGDVVELYYAGRLVDNWLFDTNDKAVAEENETYDSSRKYDPIEVTVGGTGFIEGFNLALKNLSTRSTVKVIIPSEFAYGIAGTESIPPYAPLIFELRILGKTNETPDPAE